MQALITALRRAAAAAAAGGKPHMDSDASTPSPNARAPVDLPSPPSSPTSASARTGPRTQGAFFSVLASGEQVQINSKDLAVVASHFLTTDIARVMAPATEAVLAFDERLFAGPDALAVPPVFLNVSSFFGANVRRADFRLETIVGSLILFRRFSLLTPITAYTWRLVLLVSILLSQKVVDDESLGTDQFPELWAYSTKHSAATFDLASKTVGRLETDMLKLCGFSVNIKAKEWFTAHMELRDIWLREFNTPVTLNLPTSDTSKTFIRRYDSKERATVG